MVRRAAPCGPGPAGMRCDALNEARREKLLALASQWFEIMPPRGRFLCRVACQMRVVHRRFHLAVAREPANHGAVEKAPVGCNSS